MDVFEPNLDVFKNKLKLWRHRDVIIEGFIDVGVLCFLVQIDRLQSDSKAFR